MRDTHVGNMVRSLVIASLALTANGAEHVGQMRLMHANTRLLRSSLRTMQVVESGIPRLMTCAEAVPHSYLAPVVPI